MGPKHIHAVILVGGKAEPYGAWAVQWIPGQSQFSVHNIVEGQIDPKASKVFTHSCALHQGNDSPPTLQEAVTIMAEWIKQGELFKPAGG